MLTKGMFEKIVGGEKMSRISEEQVRHVANLARLAMSDQEVKQFRQDLDAIITYAEQLNEVDTIGVEPTSHVLNMSNVLREDEPCNWINQEEALKNAPDKKDGQFKVPSIIK